MKLDILTPEEALFSETVVGVKVPGIEGDFEMLENHAAIISALKEGTVEVTLTDKTKKVFEVKSGFVECLNNEIKVLVEGAVAA